MSCSTESDSRIKKTKVELNFPNYAAKANLKGATLFAIKDNLASLKSEFDE